MIRKSALLLITYSIGMITSNISLAALPKSVDNKIMNNVTQSNTKIVGDAPSMAMGNVYQDLSHEDLPMSTADKSENSLQQIEPAIETSAIDQINGGPPY